MAVEFSSGLQRQVEKGVSILKEGGVIAYPTDTVYGLGASVDIPPAVEKIFEIKRRPRQQALPLLLANVAQLDEVAERVPEIARRLANSFWPGGLTMIINKSSRVPDIITGGGNTVAVRVPAHPVPVALIVALKAPITGTSANLGGKPSPLTAEEVATQIGDRVDFIIDGGRCPGGVESTVVDITREPPVVLREGAISIDKLRAVISNIIREGD